MTVIPACLCFKDQHVSHHSGGRLWILSGRLHQRHRIDTKGWQGLKGNGGCLSPLSARIDRAQWPKQYYAKSLEATARHKRRRSCQCYTRHGIACQMPLKEFLTQLEDHESSLSPFPNRFALRTAGRKIKWAIEMGPEVEKLRACLAANLLCINMLLQTHAQ